jgi:hypothetical protein
MGENSYRTKEHLLIAMRTIDRGQHWHGESYPWASSIDSRIERRIGDTLLSKVSKTTYINNRLKEFEELLLDNALLKV